MKKKKKVKTGEFRLNAKKLFLTYPKNDTSKEEVEENLKEFFEDNLEGYSIGQETHEDGTLHLHICVLLKDRCDIKNANTLDVIAGKHGNYQTLKRPKNCISYTMKEDKEVILWGSVKDLMEKGEGKFTKIAKLLLDGKREREVIEEDPGFYLQNKKKVDEFINYLDEQKGIESDFEPYGWQLEVLKKLNDQDDRQITWVVDGEGNKGKSQFADWLESDGWFRCGAGKIEDICYLYKSEPNVVIDFERADQEKVQYGLLEKFKNGKIISTKYQPVKKYQKARLLVLANWEPKYSALSTDRWDIYTITPGQNYYNFN